VRRYDRPMDVPPLIITGMHRSGTSATARLLQHAGLDVGGRLMTPTLDNTLGYYEDLDFCELNLELVAAGVGDDPEHQPDWAYADLIVPERLAALRPRAAALLAGHGGRGHTWGFKDPRTAVLLDFYDDLVPDARYLFVYRPPWEVVSSLLRTRLRPLRGRADLAVRAWVTYNARLLEFRERHPERTVLVHVDAVAQRPDAVLALAREQLAAMPGATLDAGATGAAFVDRLLQRIDACDPLAELLAADHPQALELYARLEAAADLPGLAPIAAGEPPAVQVTPARGTLAVAAVLVGAADVDADDAVHLARVPAGDAPGRAADSGIEHVPDEFVAVLFEGTLQGGALSAALTAMQADPGLGAVLLGTGETLGELRDHDLLTAADAGAGIVVRRSVWLEVGGFAAGAAPCGFEAWAFAVGCLAQGVRSARIDGALHAAGDAGDAQAARLRVLERHPRLTARHADAAQRSALTAERRASEADRRAQAAEAERDRVARQLQELRATRSWRVVTGWWRLRWRLRVRRRAA